MHRPGPDLFLDDHSTGHPYQVNTGNLSGPEMAEAMCESFPHLVDCTKWGQWISFVPGSNSKQTKLKAEPKIKDSIDGIKTFGEKFLQSG
jgi:hypothetical protein